MERTLAPDVSDLISRRDLPGSVRSAMERIEPDSPIEVDEETAERVMAPLLWLTDRVGEEGLPLTKAGRLRPTDVTALMTELGWDEWWIGKNNREELTAPAGLLRGAAISAKLVRKFKGRLQLTRPGRAVADDPVKMWCHVAEHLPVERKQGDRVAAVLGMLRLLAADEPGRSTTADEAPTLFDPAAALTALGWISTDGDPISPAEFRFVWEQTSDILRAIGVQPYAKHTRTSEDRTLFLRSALTRAVPDSAAASTTGPKRRARRCHTITVGLDDIRPTIWRQIVFPSNATLLQLHEAVQSAMGWESSHLFAFEIGKLRYGYPDPYFDTTVDAASMTVSEALPEVGDQVSYEYDFGDGWSHTLTVDAIGTADDAPAVLAGANACPPEDCGGWPGYDDLIAAQSDPDHPRRAELREWLGYEFDPAAFDLAAADAAIRRRRRIR